MELAAGFSIATLVVSEMRNDHHINWKDLYDVFVCGLLESNLLPALTKVHRLAIAIVIVAAKKLIYFDVAFRFLCEWELLGGPYWIIQEEILRHLIYQIFEEALLDSFPSKKNFKTNVEIELFKLLPCPLPPYITNTTLIKKIQGLKENAATLVKEMNATDEPKVYYYYLFYITEHICMHVYVFVYTCSARYA